MTDVRAAEVEDAIKTCVREFYGKARQDPLLGPIFNKTVVDWDVHLRVIVLVEGVASDRPLQWLALRAPHELAD